MAARHQTRQEQEMQRSRGLKPEAVLSPWADSRDGGCSSSQTHSCDASRVHSGCCLPKNTPHAEAAFIL